MRIASVAESLPFAFNERITLNDSRVSAPFPGDNQNRIHAEYRYFLEASERTDHQEIMEVNAIIEALRLASDCNLSDTIDVWSSPLWRPVRANAHRWDWGHHGDSLDEVAIAFAKSHSCALRELQASETSNPLSNALRLYSVGLATEWADPAILLFIAALEALFLSDSSELKFRLSLYASHFLERDRSERFTLYTKLRKLYDVRSKIAHGADISDNRESAAFSLVEDYLPAAERIVRRALRMVFDERLVPLFLAKRRARLDELLNKLCLGFDWDSLAVQFTEPSRL